MTYIPYIVSSPSTHNKALTKVYLCFSVSLGTESMKFIINPTDGERIISGSRSLFDGYLDGNFCYWGLDIKSVPTKEQIVWSYKIIKNGTMSDFFHKRSSNFDDVCLTQSQIISFVEKYRDWFRVDNQLTFFCFKVGKHFFIAYVCLRSEGIDIYVDNLLNGRIWDARANYRIISPI